MFENFDALHELLLEVLAEGADQALRDWTDLFCEEHEIELDEK